jgi:hypothetical protein
MKFKTGLLWVSLLPLMGLFAIRIFLNWQYDWGRRYSVSAVPPKPQIPTFNDEDLAHFQEHGFVVVRNFTSPA